MAGVLVRDDNNGRLSLTPTNRASLTYRIGEKESKILAKGVEILANMWFKLGAKQIICSHRKMPLIKHEDQIKDLKEMILSDPSNLLLGATHPQSGKKIGTEPGKSVVDSNCKVHGLPNLYVIGGSVFPTAGVANPTLTIVALSLRLADHLKRLS